MKEMELNCGVQRHHYSMFSLSIETFRMPAAKRDQVIHFSGSQDCAGMALRHQAFSETTLGKSGPYGAAMALII